MTSKNDPKVQAMWNISEIPVLGKRLGWPMYKTFWRNVKRPKTAAKHKKWKAEVYARLPFSDGVDRLNCYWVPAILFFFVLLLQYYINQGFYVENDQQGKANWFSSSTTTGSQQIVSKSGSIWCLKQKEMTDDDFNFAFDYCMVQSHYYVEPEQSLNWRQQNKPARQLGYYHWVQLVLTLQAAIFLLPNILWAYVSKAGGVDFAHYVNWAKWLQRLPINEKFRFVGAQALAEDLWHIYFPDNSKWRHKNRFLGVRFGQLLGPSIALMYLCFKLIYVAIALGQFFWLDAFLGGGYRWWGWHVIQQLLHKENWQDSHLFPRMIYCQMPIRKLSDTAFNTLQCHLRINTYNEKIFLVVWFLLLFVAVLTLLNFLFYFFLLASFRWTSEATARQLLTQREFEHILMSEEAEKEQIVADFAKKHLGYEGILLFWFIKSNAGPIIARDIAAVLFSKYTEVPLQQREGFDYEEAEYEDKDDDGWNCGGNSGWGDNGGWGNNDGGWGAGNGGWGSNS